MRVIRLLEELGLGYEIVRYRRAPKTNLAPSVTLVNPRP